MMLRKDSLWECETEEDRLFWEDAKPIVVGASVAVLIGVPPLYMMYWLFNHAAGMHIAAALAQ